jgi:TIR domain-containing protein
MPEAESADKKLIVFLSHASEDKPAVRLLAKRLKDDGFDPWLDEERLLPGQNWELEIEQALRKSQVILLCFSEKSVGKE